MLCKAFSLLVPPFLELHVSDNSQIGNAASFLLSGSLCSAFRGCKDTDPITRFPGFSSTVGVQHFMYFERNFPVPG